jgi:serine protease AprX
MRRKAVFLLVLLLIAMGVFGWKSNLSPLLPLNQTQSYIVQAENAPQAALLVEQQGGVVTSHLPIINGVGARLTAETAAQLAEEDQIVRLTPNHGVETAGDKTTADYSEVVGANQVWQAGVTGAGVTIAILDSGLEDSLKGLRENSNAQNRILAWQDFYSGGSSPHDRHGHGSHVAGIAASSDLGVDNQWNGIAPDVNLVIGRVLDEQGVGSYEDVIEGIQWVIDNKDLYNIRVLNLSLVGMAKLPYWADPLNLAVMRAWSEGIVVVAAAGNGGPEPMTIGVPGNNPYVITVGAFTDAYTPADWSDDYITPFSAAGPTLEGFAKPDIVAPGAHMVAPMKTNAYLAKTYKDYRLPNKYFSMGGTSQATAVVSGIAALILSENPSLTPDQVKYRLMHTALLWTDPTTQEAGYSLWQQGAGRVNAYDAVFATTTESANSGLDIQADLNDPTGGYEGYTYFDEATNTFRLYDDPATWPAGYSIWGGGYSIWSGGYSIWSGGYSLWSGGYSIWAGDYSLWAGGYSIWSGGYSLWSGGYSLWAGGYSIWSGNEPWGAPYNQQSFAAAYGSGLFPVGYTSTSSFGGWVGNGH